MVMYGTSIISRTEWNPAKPGINKGKVVNCSLPEPGSRLLVVYLEWLMPDVLEVFCCFWVHPNREMTSLFFLMVLGGCIHVIYLLL